MRLYLLTLLFFSGVSASLSASHLVRWQLLYYFKQFGWHSPDQDLYGKGVHFDRPSTVRYSLSVLNPRVTGQGVWTGNELGSNFRFVLDASPFLEIESANLTLRLYTETNGISLEPCGYGEGGCIFQGTGTIEWMTVTFPIDVNRAKSEGVTLINRNDEGPNFCIFDEVVFGYTEAVPEPTTTEAELPPTAEPTPPPTTRDPELPTTTTNTNFCNETCEYRAIDCHTFTSCVDNDLQYFTCPLEDGLAFNPALGVCDRIENVVGCSPPKCECGYMPSYENCRDYYFCENMCRIETCQRRSCPGDLRWDVGFPGNGRNKVQQCNLPEKAHCAVLLDKN